MSSYKKRQKALKRTHRERGQVQSRQHLGLLEKHKDYVLRARNYERKKAQLKRMHEKARNRNPDEFYYKMISTKLKGGRHILTQEPDKHTPEELQLMKTQDEKYIHMKLAMESKKVQRLQSCLHHTKQMAQTPPNTRTIFVDSVEEVASYAEALEGGVGTSERRGEQKDGVEEGPDDTPKKRSTKGNKKESAYKELNQRTQRCKELERVALKMKTQKNLMGKGAKRKVKGDGSHPTIYKWKMERKK